MLTIIIFIKLSFEVLTSLTGRWELVPAQFVFPYFWVRGLFWMGDWVSGLLQAHGCALANVHVSAMPLIWLETLRLVSFPTLLGMGLRYGRQETTISGYR